MTNIELSHDKIREIVQRQNGLCAVSGKKFEEINDEIKVYALTTESVDDIDNLVAIWINADLATFKSGNEFIVPSRKYLFPYANFSSYSDEEKINDLNALYEKFNNTQHDDENIKPVINHLKGILKLAKDLAINESKWNVLPNIVQKLQTLEEQNARKRAEISETSQKFLEKYKAKIDELLQTQNKWQELRNARQKLVSLQKEISTSVSKVSKHAIEDIKKQIADAISSITQRQIQERENYEMECSDNYLQLKTKFESILSTIPDTKDFTKTRQDLIEAQKTISSKTLKRNQQEELYQIIRNGFEQLTQIQEEDKANFMAEANENYSKLLPLVDNAINIAQTADTFKEAREALIAAQTSIKGITLTKEQRDELYGKIREVFEKVNLQQEEERNHFFKESEENFQKLLAKIEAEKEKLLNNPHFKTIRENLLTIQSEIKVWKLRTDNRNKLYETLKEAFKLLDEKRNEFFETQKKQKKNKYEVLVKNLKEKYDKLVEAMQLDKDELAKMEQVQVNSDNDELSSENEKRKEILKSKIEEKDKRIQETLQRIQEIEE